MLYGTEDHAPAVERYVPPWRFLLAASILVVLYVAFVVTL